MGTWDQGGMSTLYDSKSGKSEIALCFRGSVPQYKAKSKKKSPAKAPNGDIVAETEKEKQRDNTCTPC